MRYFCWPVLDAGFDSDNQAFIASLVVDVAHGHTISMSEIPTAAGKSATPISTIQTRRVTSRATQENYNG